MTLFAFHFSVEGERLGKVIGSRLAVGPLLFESDIRVQNTRFPRLCSLSATAVCYNVSTCA